MNGTATKGRFIRQKTYILKFNDELKLLVLDYQKIAMTM